MFDLIDHVFSSGHGVLPIDGAHTDTLPDDYPPPKPKPKPSDPPEVFTPPSTNTLPDDYPPQPPR